MMYLILLLNLGVALVMAVQLNFYFNSVFGKQSSKPTKWIYILAFIIVDMVYDRQVSDLRSRKASPEYHGFGLTNIRRICEKYGGHMTIETEPQTFDNMVVLPFGI
ncbi:hypothetical protein D3C81_1702460 [compost metagenome]